MATSTFYPSLDGRVSRQVNPSNESWATIRAGAGTHVDDSSATETFAGCRTEDNTADKYDILYRSILLFDTSSIPDGDVITGATLSIKPSSIDSSYTTNYNVVSSNPASTSSLAASDFGNLGSTKFSTAIAISSMSAGTYVDFTLNASGLANISKTGISKFGIILEEDLDNSRPIGDEFYDVSSVFGYFSEQTGTSSDPKLVVTHAPVSTFTPKVFIM